MELAAYFFTLVISTPVLPLSIEKLGKWCLYAALHATRVLDEVYARGQKRCNHPCAINKCLPRHSCDKNLSLFSCACDQRSHNHYDACIWGENLGEYLGTVADLQIFKGGCKPPRGVWGHAPPEKVCNFNAPKVDFETSGTYFGSIGSHSSCTLNFVDAAMSSCN